MITNNNKKRLLELINILKENTDSKHQLSINQIITLLQERGIEINNRKTLYDDFKVLNDYEFIVDYDKGYYLSEAPFSLSEIKIITDSLNTLKNIDDKVLNRIINKLYSFLSTYETNFLKKLEYKNVHKDRKFINRLEDTLQAIENHSYIIIKRENKESEMIAPLFLHRSNDYYYLFYHYQYSNKLYHTRFDNVLSIKFTEIKDEINITRQTLINYIDEASNSYYTNKSQNINFIIIEDNDYLRNRLRDDFPNIMFTKDGFNIKCSINEAFFSKLVSYGTKIKISNPEIADSYIDYLNSIINIHTNI